MIASLAMIVFGTIAKACLTGIGLATGFAIVYGFPRVMDEVAQGVPFHVALRPAWYQNLKVNPYKEQFSAEEEGISEESSEKI